jgi:hypothetical protein
VVRIDSIFLGILYPFSNFVNATSIDATSSKVKGSIECYDDPTDIISCTDDPDTNTKLTEGKIDAEIPPILGTNPHRNILSILTIIVAL